MDCPPWYNPDQCHNGGMCTTAFYQRTNNLDVHSHYVSGATHIRVVKGVSCKFKVWFDPHLYYMYECTRYTKINYRTWSQVCRHEVTTETILLPDMFANPATVWSTLFDIHCLRTFNFELWSRHLRTKSWCMRH